MAGGRRATSIGVGLVRICVEAYASFAEEAATLRQAMWVVAENLRLMVFAASTAGPVHRALVQHLGAQERICARLVGRMEQYQAEAAALLAKFDAQHGHHLSECRSALQLWWSRQEVGAAARATPEAASSAERLLAVLSEMEDVLRQWREHLSGGHPYFSASAAQSLPPMPEPAVDISAALDCVEALHASNPGVLAKVPRSRAVSQRE
mmetsp:Transcript_59483/g.184539  ORF Transcript_59483/g.184539 Transcript_59483/m.184539 type:complete len:208 (-) Transcript_59483:3-626(-)